MEGIGICPRCALGSGLIRLEEWLLNLIAALMGLVKRRRVKNIGDSLPIVTDKFDYRSVLMDCDSGLLRLEI
jgi:hypothetical protein